MRGVGVGCRGADAPLRRRRRLHRHGARRQPARGLHGRARDRREDDAGARARDRLLGDDVRAPAGGGRNGSRSDLQPGPRDAVRRVIRSSARRGCWRSRSSATSSSSRPGPGSCPSRSTVTSRARSCSGACSSRSRRSSHSRTRHACWTCSGSSARSCPSSCTTTARRTSSSRCRARRRSQLSHPNRRRSHGSASRA